MWTDLFAAIALVFVIEGIMPFAFPQKWKEMISQVSALPNRPVRVMGGVSMVIGLLLLYWVRG